MNSRGLEKSLRIRVNVDVREPLKDKVKLKVRGGQVCFIPVHYERFTMFCFYYGRLRHGSSECIDVLRESTPEKRFRISLRASPWKMVREDDDLGKQSAKGAY